MTGQTQDTKASRLLLTCSRMRLDPESIGEIRELIRSGVDWVDLIRIAIPHGLLPLIGRNLAAHATDLVPPTTLLQLERQRTRTEQRNRSQALELIRIVDMFAKSAIRALPFKGPLLAMAAYGDLSLRESHDLDIWVHPMQLAEAGNILREQNYRGAGHTRGTVHLLKRDGGSEQSEFLNVDTGVLIELHDHLQSPQFSFSPDFDDVWNRRIEIDLEGASIAAICPEDLLLALAVHGSKHMWRRLSWLVDIAGLIERTPLLNWPQILSRATQWHARRRLMMACALTESLLRTPIAAQHGQEFRGRFPSNSSVKRVERHILQDLETRTLANFLSELRNHAENADNLADRYRIISSYSKKIMHVDEERMLRSMDDETKMLYKFSKGVRLILRRLAN